MTNKKIVEWLVAIALNLLNIICIGLLFMITEKGWLVFFSILYGCIVKCVWDWTQSFEITQDNQ